MPVWYSLVAEEHRAVRTAAGLFDVAHMGVLEVAGEHATAFLDAVTTNFVWGLQDGQSQYTYLLDPDGNVLDDLIVYRRAADRYLVVVNAANTDQDWAWFNAVNDGAAVIDREKPTMRLPSRAVLRNLKDPASGTEQRVDLALQGPASRAILQELTDDPRTQDALQRLRRTDLLEIELAGLNVIVARTGYTGEAIGYELFVHPDKAVKLWRVLLEKGEPHGLLPCGLAARDSTRIEAGLPLYGHELAGEYQINPHEAGFSPYVKFHKAFFIGRTPSRKQAAQRTREIVRFRLEEAGVRALRGGEAVVNGRGAYIGRVTSCTLVEGVQVGLALVERSAAAPGLALAIYPAATGHGPAIKPPADLSPGDRVILPVRAMVRPRFRERDT
jgi:glycine hydroxymethyltransferase